MKQRLAKHILIGALLFLATVLPCNCMADTPLQQGAGGSSQLERVGVDVLHEKLRITPDKTFERARFEVDYEILCDSKVSIPLLFLSCGYLDSFEVFVNGVEVDWEDARSPIWDSTRGAYQIPAISFDFDTSGYDTTYIPLPQDHFKHCESGNKTFWLSVKPGTHIVSIRYRGYVFHPEAMGIKEYNFIYSFYQGGSFDFSGSHELQVDLRPSGMNVKSNMGNPHLVTPDSVAVWKFTALPADRWIISLVPDFSIFQRMVAWLGGDGIWLIFAFIVYLLTCRMNYRFRLINPEKSISKPLFWRWQFAAVISVCTQSLADGIYQWVLTDKYYDGQFAGSFIILLTFLYPILFLAATLTWAFSDGIIFWYVRKYKVNKK